MSNRRTFLATGASGLAATALVSVAGLVHAAAAIDLDAELLALREPWMRTRDSFNAALKLKDEVDTLAMVRWPSYPTFGEWSGDYASYQAETERISAVRNSIGIEEGRPEADRLEDETSTANAAIVDQIAAMQARTLRGLAFKAEVSADWNNDHPELVASIMADIGTLAGMALA